jgi:hypothetical protein
MAIIRYAALKHERSRPGVTGRAIMINGGS